MSDKQIGREKQRLFVDMDGTLAVFTPVNELETLYEKGWFANAEPIEKVCEAVKLIIKNNPEKEVHILSAYLTDSKYALSEKNEWLDKYLPEIPTERRIFVPCGSDKKEAIPNGVRPDDFLLDDYTNNLVLWQPPARGIKLLNGINHTKGTWKHDTLRYDKEPQELAKNIVDIMNGKMRVVDEKPLKLEDEKVNHRDYDYGENKNVDLSNERSNDMAERSNNSNIERKEEAPASSTQSENKEKLKEELMLGVQCLMDTDKFKNWLASNGKLFYNNYSFRNALLIWLQKPEATYTMGYDAWKEFGRSVKRGAEGARIFVPVVAYEKQKGDFMRMVEKTLDNALREDAALNIAACRLGASNMEITRTRAGVYGRRINGKDAGFFSDKKACEKFISECVIGKTVMYYTVGHVFDRADTFVPKYLWLRNGFKKEDMERDENGNAIRNGRGEYKVKNTLERINRLVTSDAMSPEIAAQDPQKMEVLFSALVNSCAAKSLPVAEVSKDTDDVLKEGAKGYFHRGETEQDNGYIVIDYDLPQTEKVAVLLHEMAHSDLHGNIQKLAVELGEKEIPRGMREVQAEAVAYMTGQMFGLETETSSFDYIAAWATGYELAEIQKSFEVMYREYRNIVNDVRAELDAMGYNLDLTPKENRLLTADEIMAAAAPHVATYLNRTEQIADIKPEIDNLYADANEQQREILMEQVANVTCMDKTLFEMNEAFEKLSNAQSRAEQEELIETIGTLETRFAEFESEFNNFSEMYIKAKDDKVKSLKAQFNENPKEVIKKAFEENGYAERLSDAALKYLSTSKFVSRELAPLLNKDVAAFAQSAVMRLDAIDKIAAKNGAFVEVAFCEQWTDKAVFDGGTLCHPAVANSIVKQAETQLRDMRAEAEKAGEYFPYSKCDITVYAPTEAGRGLSGINTRIDIGDMEQADLTEHLESICKRGKIKNEILNKFNESLNERGTKEKLTVPVNATEAAEHTGKTMDEWLDKIADKRSADAQNASEEKETKKDKNKNKDEAERE